jgi:hypothetical protein
MAADKTVLYVLYQMGNSEDWTWFSPLAVFLSEKALREYANKKELPPDVEILTPTVKNEVRLSEPQEFVLVKSLEGEVPEVELEMEGLEEARKE